MKCNVCGKDKTPDCIAVRIKMDGLESFPAIKKEFGKTRFNVCFSCYLQSLGIMNKKQKEMNKLISQHGTGGREL